MNRYVIEGIQLQNQNEGTRCTYTVSQRKEATWALVFVQNLHKCLFQFALGVCSHTLPTETDVAIHVHLEF